MSNLSWKRNILGIIFLLLSILYTVLFFQKANFSDTMVFNIAHLKSLSNVFTSPINFDYWNHSGSLINLFSPWLTILSGWVFVNINIPFGFSIYLILITFLTLVSAYFYMNKFANDTFAALFFSVVYTFSMNRFWLVFHNQRLENYLVLIFLPMVYYGAYLFFKNESWKTLAWGMTLIIWTSPFVAIGVLATLIPMGILMIFSKISHRWAYWGELIVNSLKLFGIILITTIGFIGPLIHAQIGNRLVQNSNKNFNYLVWLNSFKFTLVQRYSLWGAGVLMVLLLVLIFLKSSFSYKLVMLEIIPLTLIMLFGLKNPVVDLSRLVLSFQSILDLFLAILVSRMAILIFQEGPGVLKLLLVIATVSGLGWFNYNQASDIRPQQTLIASQGVNYSKIAVDYHDNATNGQNKFLVDNQKTAVSFFTKKNDYWIQYYDPESALLDLPIQKYSGYKIQLNNEAVETSISKRKTLQLRTHPGKNIIEIHSQYDWIGIGSLLINLCGFIGLTYLSIRNLVWKNKKVPENS